MTQFCELCDKPTKRWAFPCRDPEYGNLAEIEICCKDCHDEWCLCDCPRRKFNKSIEKTSEKK